MLIEPENLDNRSIAERRCRRGDALAVWWPCVCRWGCVALLVTALQGPANRAEAPRGEPSRDLIVPAISEGPPAAGRRVRQINQRYVGSNVHHLLYLPVDWKAGETYPVIVEYAGNQYRTSPGTVEGSNLGYGITAGKGVIWICMPYVNTTEMRNQETWWGDVDATVGYCKQTVQRICDKYGGDKENIFIAGFSRGAIGCNFIGLHDDEIASLWRGFICHSHYDGVKKWPYRGSDRASAAERLRRLGNRPQFISHENTVAATRDYLAEVMPGGNFTFQTLKGWPHTDTWVLHDIPERKRLRSWFAARVQSKQQLQSKQQE